MPTLPGKTLWGVVKELSTRSCLVCIILFVLIRKPILLIKIFELTTVWAMLLTVMDEVQ